MITKLICLLLQNLKNLNLSLKFVWLSSKTKGEIVIINPENVPNKFNFEFKSPDILLQNALQDDKVVNQITLTREKSNIIK